MSPQQPAQKQEKKERSTVGPQWLYADTHSVGKLPEKSLLFLFFKKNIHSGIW